MTYADVILPVALDGAFTYALPDEMAGKCAVGSRLLVPLGKIKVYSGVVVSVHDQPPAIEADKVKAAIALLDPQPVVMPQQLKLWQWVADYYMCPMGDVMTVALPAGLKADTTYRPPTETMVALGDKFKGAEGTNVALDMLRRAPRSLAVLKTFLALRGDTADNSGAISREELMNESHASAAIVKRLVTQGFLKTMEREVTATAMNSDYNSSKGDGTSTLTEAQQLAHDEVAEQWKDKDVVLLHGVTSSGKTEIYSHFIEETIRKGGQVLYLLPEIALTVQMTSRLRRMFGDKLAIYHSRYSDAERTRIWRRQLSVNPYPIVLGARSAVFLPFQRLRLVIVDEEHETSFKQQDPAPRYHARSVALVLARQYGAKALLGTATPSVESFQNARTGKYGYVSLTTRYAGMQLPKVEVVDVHDLRRRKMMKGLFSPRLLEAMGEALDNGRQVILFQNRRGFAPVVECKICGWTPRCPNCDVTLTMHKRLNALTCHYCGHTEAVPMVCPNCGNPRLGVRGFGTEKIEESIMEALPAARVARMDLDTTRTKGAYERIIGEFARGGTNVLVGTQMVTKGLDFDRVAVVGILNADTMLNTPDFRAYEHAFQMMSQVAGRAGRRGQGLVILQTRQPDLPVIEQVVNNDYEAFFNDVIEERQLFRYPPFTRLIYAFLRHKEDGIVEAAAQNLAARLRGTLGEETVLGPDKPSVARVKNMSIRKIVLKVPLTMPLSQLHTQLRELRETMLMAQAFKQVQVFFDVDPL